MLRWLPGALTLSGEGGLVGFTGPVVANPAPSSLASDLLPGLLFQKRTLCSTKEGNTCMPLGIRAAMHVPAQEPSYLEDRWIVPFGSEKACASESKWLTCLPVLDYKKEPSRSRRKEAS